MTDVEQLNLESGLRRFGLRAFRPGQEEVIGTVLGRRDCLCVMPTGSGKSLCYQLPALMLDGLTLVVSPLIALMKNQVDQLEALDVPVTFINSLLPLDEQHRRLDAMAAGRYRLVYVVPERFRSSRFLEAVRTARLSLLAIDEAHCISEWGHDFRPDYARLGSFRRLLGNPITIALTATATDAVRRDIVEQLRLDDPKTFVTGFARPNLFYEVRFPRTERQKADMLIEFLRQTPGCGIVYASSRKRTEEVAELIHAKLRRSAAAYHAGLSADQRKASQDAFMQGRVEIVAATTAFGMGIDKADVRFVIHYNMPGSLEAYYQEAGRAGRDGEPSCCLMLYNASDRYIQEFFIESAHPARENVARVHDFLQTQEADPIELTQQDIKECLGLPISADGVGTCEQLLESAGVLERLMASDNRAAVRLDSDLPTLVDLVPRRATVRRRVLQAVEKLVGPRRQEMVFFRPHELIEAAELDQTSVTAALRELNQLQAFTYVPPFRGRAIRMLKRDVPMEELDIDFDAVERLKASEYDKLNRVSRFAMTSRCRQQEILDYFGETGTAPCAHCDNCRQRGVDRIEPSSPNPPDEQVLKAIRIVLSGVARTQARFRCGKNLIAQMLCGSASAKVSKLGLSQLSTFGLLSDLKQTDVVTLIDALIATGHLEQVDLERMRPVVQLTESGTQLMKGEAEFDSELPVPADLLCKLSPQQPPERPTDSSSSSPVAAEEPEDVPPADPALTDSLREWRRETADRAGVPAFHVFSNATMEEVARRRPATPDALLEVKGIGPAKLEQYGDAILRLVAEHSDGQTAYRPSHYWTWRLLSKGFSSDECQAIRGLGPGAIVDHALRAVAEGLPVQPEWCLSAELLEALENLIDPARPPAATTLLLPQLPPGTRHEEVDLYVECRRQTPEP